MTRVSSPTPEHERLLQEKIRDGSQDLNDYRALADLLLSVPGREYDAFTVLEQALTLSLPDVQRADVAAQMAWLLWEFGRTERAVRMAQDALAHVAAGGPTPEVLLIRGISHATLAHGQYAEDRAASDEAAQRALDVFEQLFRQHPDFEDIAFACHYAARVCMLRGDYTKALALYDQAMRVDASDRSRLSALTYSAGALRCQGRYGEAEQRLRQALGMVEADRRLLPMIHFELGKLHRLTGDPAEAAGAFEQALTALATCSPLFDTAEFIVETHRELGESCYDAARYGEAIVAFREALPGILQFCPDLYCYTLISLGHSYLVTKQYAKARECYKEVVATAQASDEEKARAREGLASLPSLPPPRVH